MIDIFKIVGTITLNGADKAGKAIESIANKAEKTAKAITKIGTAAIGAASAGVVALTKSAVEEYANYEQLVGGVETLFKDAAETVQKYADNAYKTAGLSANEYMETVTSFSASLLQSLGGDTEAAAEKANTAITDMSDNANKMGTDMTMIQNAYSGFAKQNYTMLDNLKLGYGGTKEEMQRLIDDANALNKAQGKNTDYTIESYADIIDAIHDVQTEMGITGTTAKEASTTIQGSVASAKSAWKNLLVGISDDNQDFDKLVGNFVESVETAADNIIPRVEKSLDGILDLVSVASKKIIPRVVMTISEKAPDLIEAGAEIVLALGDGIVDNLDGILAAAEKTITRIVPKFANAFSDLIPKIAKSAGKIIKEIDGAAISVAGLYGAFKSLTKGNWIGVGIGLITAAFGLSKKAAQKHKEEILGLTDAEKELIEAGKEAADTINAAKEARDENISSVLLETEKTKDLWKELQTLVDENGNVLGSNHERVDYILGELNYALGTEYALNGDIIGQYDTMVDKIDELIQKKQLSALLDAGKDTYADAVMNNGALWDRVTEEQEKLNNAQSALDEALKNPDDHMISTMGGGWIFDPAFEKAISEAKADLDDALSAAEANANTISTYDTAMKLSAQGKTAEATAAFLSNYDPTERWKAVDPDTVTGADAKDIMSGIQQLKDRIGTLEGLYGKNPDGAIAGTLSGFKEDLGDMLETYSAALVKPFSHQPSRFVDAHWSAVAQARQEAQTTETTININVHADTDDLGVKIAQAINDAISGAMQAVGNSYRGGRTSHAY